MTFGLQDKWNKLMKVNETTEEKMEEMMKETMKKNKPTKMVLDGAETEDVENTNVELEDLLLTKGGAGWS